MKLKLSDKSIIEKFVELGFVHEVKKQPMINFNQLTRGNESFIFFFVGDKIVIQNFYESSFITSKKEIEFEYSEKTKTISFRHGTTFTFSLVIEVKEK